MLANSLDEWMLGKKMNECLLFYTETESSIKGWRRWLEKGQWWAKEPKRLWV
jgi:hypothetical protein